jgi:UDP-N-acetylmuramoyl-L-alanyl-D-glutamate--2,6-diaminopimelate ligase
MKMNRATPAGAPPEPAARTLGALLGVVAGASPPLARELSETPITGVTDHTADVAAGTLFVAVSGGAADGHALLQEAVARGAAAVLVEHLPETLPPVPVLRVSDSRRALAELAAAWHNHPAHGLPLIGISGTIGKTSVLGMLEAMAREAGIPLGTVGSLGVGMAGRLNPTGYTAPDALTLHESLARLRAEGARSVAMEVTSHALVQQRVHGLEFDAAVFTNLVPFEHVDYHGSFRGYVDAKSRFFDTIAPGAPLFYNVDDRAVRGVVRDRPLRRFGCGRARTAWLRIEPREVTLDGTRFDLRLRRPLPRLDGSEVAPLLLPVNLPLLGGANATNAALATAAALWLGADGEQVVAALAGIPPVRRRMEVLHRGEFMVLDDTTGHPDSVSAVFTTIAELPVRHAHVVFGIRGMRGRRINRRLAETLAVWVRQRPGTRLTITSSEEAADERNRVLPREREAFVEALRKAGVDFMERARCDEAVTHAFAAVEPGDSLLLLGAQGMDRARETAASLIQTRAT